MLLGFLAACTTTMELGVSVLVLAVGTGWNPVEYESLGVPFGWPQGWADEAPAWEAQGGTILSIQTMQSGTGYQRVSHHKLADPAAHIAALGEFARVLRGS